MESPTRVSRPNTSPKGRQVINSQRRLGAGAILFLALVLAGCGPKYTYPAQKVPGSIEDICKKEYNIDAKARVVGKTVGVIVYLDSIRDDKGQVPKEVHEVMGKVLQVVTRVALSSDLPLDFSTVLIRDRSAPIELVITRSLDDTRRANADVIGVEESINRTLFGQASYKSGQADSFTLKDIRLENFLTDQIAQRIRFLYAKETPEGSTPEPLALADGVFEVGEGKRSFVFSVIALKSEDPRETLLKIFKTVNQVIEGYHFTGFDQIEIQDYMNRQKMVVDQPTLLAYQKKTLSEDQLWERCVIESQSIQEAFKLFGFSLPKNLAEKDNAVVAASATP